MTEPQEIDIINRVLDGDSDAFAALVVAYQAMLLRVIAGILNDRRDLAEEIAQDVLVEAYRRLPDFDPARSPFRSWLLMIARSRAINALKKKRPTYLAEIPESAEMPPESRADEWQLLDTALHQLPPKQKRALLLAQVDGPALPADRRDRGHLRRHHQIASEPRPRVPQNHPIFQAMRETPHQQDEQDARLEQWAEHRRSREFDSREFTRSVMERIRPHERGAAPTREPAPRFQQVALTAACATAGIGKILIVIHLAI